MALFGFILSLGSGNPGSDLVSASSVSLSSSLVACLVLSHVVIYSFILQTNDFVIFVLYIKLYHSENESRSFMTKSLRLVKFCYKMVVIDCASPGCAFQSEDASEAVACAILQSHAFSHKAPGPNFNRSPSEGPKLTRPSVDVGVSLEAWNAFTRRWQMFRQGSGINEVSATAQLFQCASQSLGDSLLKSDAEIVSKPLQELLSAMRRLAVIPVVTGVL